MNYQPLKQPRYFLTPEEVADGKSFIIFTLYDHLLEYRVGEGKRNIPKMIVLDQEYSPLSNLNLHNHSEKKRNEIIIRLLEDIELTHQAASLFQLEQPFRNIMDEKRKTLLSLAISMIGKEKFIHFRDNILFDIFPSLKNKSVLPLILPARNQKGKKEKKEDKYRFYFKAIKKAQILFTNEQVIYLEGNDSPFGLLLLISKEEKPIGPVPFIPAEHARSIDDYRKYLGTAPYPLS